MGCVVVVAVVNVVTLSRCVLEVAIYVGAATLYSSCCMLFRSPCQQRQRPLASIVVFSCRWPLSARNPAARAPASRPTVACWSILLLFASRWRHDVVSERPQRGILAPRPTRPDPTGASLLRHVGTDYGFRCGCWKSASSSSSSV